LEREGAAARPALRRAYEELLAEFPLCYGYWDKLARLEKAEAADDSMAPAAAVYERGVAAVKCWELYLKFCACAVQQCGLPEQITDFNAPQDAKEHSAEERYARDLFARATREVGAVYDSVKLWDAWYAFEDARPKDVMMKGESFALPARLAAVAFRAAAAPIRREASARYFELFTKHLAEGDAKQIAASIAEALPAADQDALQAGGGVLAATLLGAAQVCVTVPDIFQFLCVCVCV